MKRGIEIGAAIMASAVFLAILLGAIMKLPILFSVITSESMSPRLHRGDLAITIPLFLHEPQEGDIAVFQPWSSTWVSHRIVGGSAASGFYTRGDANSDTDQVINGYPRIGVERIKATIPEAFGGPLRIPGAGYLSLSLERITRYPYFPSMAGFAVFLLLMAPPSSRVRQVSRRSKGNSSIFPYLVMILALGFATGTATRCAVLPQEYDVVATPEGRYAGSGTRGILRYEAFTQTTKLQNNSFVPMVFSVSSTVQDFRSSPDWAVLWPGESQEVVLTMGADTLGRHFGEVRIGVFLPVIPPEALHALTNLNYWLAVSVTSLVPASPVLLLWLLTAQRKRSRITRRAAGQSLRTGLATGR